MTQTQEKFVRYETDGKVGIITLDRADKLNAINHTMKDQIIEAFAVADKDPATSVLVLRAEGRSFSAGFDIGMSPDRAKDRDPRNPSTWDPTLHRSFDFGMLWFGIGNLTTILIVFYAATFPMEPGPERHLRIWRAHRAR